MRRGIRRGHDRGTTHRGLMVLMAALAVLTALAAPSIARAADVELPIDGGKRTMSVKGNGTATATFTLKESGAVRFEIGWLYSSPDPEDPAYEAAAYLETGPNHMQTSEYVKLDGDVRTATAEWVLPAGSYEIYYKQRATASDTHAVSLGVSFGKVSVPVAGTLDPGGYDAFAPDHKTRQTARRISLDRPVASSTSDAWSRYLSGATRFSDWYSFELPRAMDVDVTWDARVDDVHPTFYRVITVDELEPVAHSTGPLQESFTGQHGYRWDLGTLAAGEYLIALDMPNETYKGQYLMTVETSAASGPVTPPDDPEDPVDPDDPTVPDDPTGPDEPTAKPPSTVISSAGYDIELLKGHDGYTTITGVGDGTLRHASVSSDIVLLSSTYYDNVLRLEPIRVGTTTFTVWREEGHVYGPSEPVEIRVTVRDESTTTKKPVYRLYNRWSGEHLYTTDAGERAALVGDGWDDEGVAWYSDPTGEDVYRLFNRWNPEIASHHYTVDRSEYDRLVREGWNGEGPKWLGVR